MKNEFMSYPEGYQKLMKKTGTLVFRPHAGENDASAADHPHRWLRGDGMIIIGEKINGAIPSVRQAIAERNDALIIERTLAQVKAGADFLDCAPSTSTEIEYETMVWLLGLMQG